VKEQDRSVYLTVSKVWQSKKDQAEEVKM